MAAVLASVVTLVGTLAVCGVGFWQWQRQQKSQRSADYQARRVAALTTVWDALNEIEEEQRKALMIFPVGRKQDFVGEHLRTINLLIMRNAPFLMDDERIWATSIVSYILQIDAALRISPELVKEQAEWWVTSRPSPDYEIGASRVAHDLRSARILLARRYAQVVKGDHP